MMFRILNEPLLENDLQTFHTKIYLSLKRLDFSETLFVSK